MWKLKTYSICLYGLIVSDCLCAVICTVARNGFCREAALLTVNHRVKLSAGVVAVFIMA